MNKCSLFVVVLAMLSMTGVAHGTNSWYMSPSGSDSNACTQSAPCATFQHVFPKMSGGDTLYLANGTYTGSGNVISQSNLPPSGTSGQHTTITATNIPCQNGVACNQPLLAEIDGGSALSMQVDENNTLSSSYVTIKGIYFHGSIFLNGVSHWYIKQCAVEGNQDGNNHTITSDGNPYMVFEDVVAFGKGRYKFNFYGQEGGVGVPTYSVCRRCVARHDYFGGDASDPMATFSDYHSYNNAFLNCIDVDSNQPAYWSTNELDGSFQQAVDNSSNQAIEWKGCISINAAMPVAYTEHNGAGGVTYTDLVGVNTYAGIAGGAWSGTRVNIINANSNNFSGVPSPVISGTGFKVQGGGPSQTLNYSLVRGTNNGTITYSGGSLTGDYFNYYPSSQSSAFTPAHTYTTDPGSNGLLYPIRTESGSNLAAEGIGAQILYTLGPDGCEYGQTCNGVAYDASTGTSIWPWPLEAWVKAQLAAMDTAIGGTSMPSPTRGFCASQNGLYGGPVTLTSYVWEALGNALPSSIYSGSGTLTAPSGLHIVSP